MLDRHVVNRKGNGKEPNEMYTGIIWGYTIRNIGHKEKNKHLFMNHDIWCANAFAYNENMY